MLPKTICAHDLYKTGACASGVDRFNRIMNWKYIRDSRVDVESTIQAFADKKYFNDVIWFLCQHLTVEQGQEIIFKMFELLLKRTDTDRNQRKMLRNFFRYHASRHLHDTGWTDDPQLRELEQHLPAVKYFDISDLIAQVYRHEGMLDGEYYPFILYLMQEIECIDFDDYDQEQFNYQTTSKYLRIMTRAMGLNIKLYGDKR